MNVCTVHKDPGRHSSEAPSVIRAHWLGMKRGAPTTFVEQRACSSIPTLVLCFHATPWEVALTQDTRGTNHSPFHGYKTDLQFWGNKYRLREGFPGRWCHCLRTKSTTLRLFHKAVRNRKMCGAFVLKFLSTSEIYCVLNSLFIPDLLDL